MEPLEAPRGRLSDRFEALGDYLSEFGELIERGEVALSPGQVAAAKIYSGGAILFLVPWLALLLRVTDRRGDWFLPEHFVFSLHLHSFGLFSAMLMELIPLPTAWLSIPFLMSVCYVYLVVAISKVHPGFTLAPKQAYQLLGRSIDSF